MLEKFGANVFKQNASHQTSLLSSVIILVHLMGVVVIARLTNLCRDWGPSAVISKCCMR